MRVLYFLLSLNFAAVAAPKGIPATKLAAQLESIVPKKKDVRAGVIVASLEKGDILYERNADVLFIPASVAKIFTAYTALKRLKPQSTFKTSVYINGTLKEGHLIGDLYLKGGGDPSLVSERLWMLTNELVRSGIKRITGQLVADASYFDEERTPGSRPKYLKDEAYNAPIGALSFNFNTTTIYVKPGEKAGGPPVVYTDPENSYVDVVNQAQTGETGSKNSIQVSRLKYVEGDLGDTVLIRGSIPQGHKELRYFRNIVNPALYTAHMFKNFWAQRGLKLTGNVVEGTVPPGARLLLEFESLPLWQVVWGLNKFSNNFVADQILKKIGAEVKGPPGTRAKGVAVVQETLQGLGIPAGSFQFIDGSGLTRDTKVSPRQLLTVLKSIYRDFSIGPEFISSLGVAGEDGTLKSRFPNSIAQGYLRAKTGSLDGVNALAGFTQSRDDEKLAFVILLNDPKNKQGSMIHWIDEMGDAITEFSRK